MFNSTGKESQNRVQRMGAWLRHLPEVKGKPRLARYLLRHDLEARNLSLNDFEGNSFVVPQLSEPMALALLTSGAYEPHTREAILKRLGPTSVFVDVGANIGLFSIPAARKACNGTVFAIEASRTIAAYLTENVTRNHLANVRILTFAATDVSGKRLPFYNAPPEKFGMGSLAAQFGPSDEFVESRTLDEMVPQEEWAQVGVIKIDVEGYESRVFQGATKLLDSIRPPLVLFEFWDWAEARADVGGAGTAQSVLAGMGYRIWRLEDWRRGHPPLREFVTRGGAMLVAERK